MTDEHIVEGNRRPLQVAKIKQGGWTKEARRRFLAALAETCNVRMATEASGMRGKSAYDLRKRDPMFATLWQEALAIGYERLEEALLRHALTSLNAIELGEYSDEIDAECPNVAAMARRAAATPGSGLHPATLGMGQVQVALAILNRHRATVEGRRGIARGRRRATAAETDAALRHQLDMLARRLARSEGGAGGGEACDSPAEGERSGTELDA